MQSKSTSIYVAIMSDEIVAINRPSNDPTYILQSQKDKKRNYYGITDEFLEYRILKSLLWNWENWEREKEI